MKNSFKDALAEIASVIVNLKTTEDYKIFLEDIMTPQEIVDLSDRIRIIKMLKSGKTQREISEELGISVTTVNR